jgi:hypothetical protein
LGVVFGVGFLDPLGVVFGVGFLDPLGVPFRDPFRDLDFAGVVDLDFAGVAGRELGFTLFDTSLLALLSLF